MRTKPIILVLVLALAAFGITACGSDDSDSTTAAGTTADSTTEQSTTETDTSASSSSKLDIEADPSGQLAYTTGDLTTKAGTVEIDFDNPSQVPHDVVIESSDGEEIGGTDVITDSTATADVDLEPGTYTYFCSVPGHREAGMEGKLTVK